jgi:hypothetical protein
VLLTLARANYGLGGSGSLEKSIPSCPTAVGAENTASNEGKRGAEQVLISRILAGEKDLFLELVRPYQRTVYATVISMLGSKEDPEDVTQDALLKALARLHQLTSRVGIWHLVDTNCHQRSAYAQTKAEAWNYVFVD